MARKKTAAKPREESPEVARARLERVAAFLAEEARWQPAVLGETAEDLNRVSSSFKAFLADKAKSVEHALGLVRPGNPGKTRCWSRLAAKYDSAGMQSRNCARLCWRSARSTNDVAH